MSRIFTERPTVFHVDHQKGLMLKLINLREWIDFTVFLCILYGNRIDFKHVNRTQA
jgi:hypothetical protein